jgi:hypothetical protein
MKTPSKGFLFAALSTLAMTCAAAPYGDNTKEQKATQSVDQEMAAATEKLNAACSTQITAAIDWKAYATFTEADRAGRTMDNIYSIARSQTIFALRNITDGCKEKDGLFKANVAKKLKRIVFTPSKAKEVNAKNPSHTFKLADGVFTVTYNFKMSNESASAVKSYF